MSASSPLDLTNILHVFYAQTYMFYLFFYLMVKVPFRLGYNLCPPPHPSLTSFLLSPVPCTPSPQVVPPLPLLPLFPSPSPPSSWTACPHNPCLTTLPQVGAPCISLVPCFPFPTHSFPTGVVGVMFSFRVRLVSILTCSLPTPHPAMQVSLP